MKMKVKVINGNDNSVTKYTVEISGSRCCKLNFSCLGILIASLIFALLVGIGTVIMAGVWKPLENKCLVSTAMFVVITIITAIVVLKFIKPFAKMAFLKQIMHYAECMICCDLCDDDNSNENQTQGNESPKGKTGKNDGKDAASDNQQNKESQKENNEPDEGEGSETQGGDNSSSGAQQKSNQDDEPCSIAKAKLDAEKDLIKKFCDTLAEL